MCVCMDTLYKCVMLHRVLFSNAVSCPLLDKKKFHEMYHQIIEKF